jgi:hypothetical protein
MIRGKSLRFEVQMISWFTGTYIQLVMVLVLSACAGPVRVPAPSAASGERSPALVVSPSVLAQGALPNSAYEVEWFDSRIPPTMSAGQTATISVTVRNAGDATWPSAIAHSQSGNNVYVSYHWLAAQSDEVLLRDGLWSSLPKDIAPGESFTLSDMPVKALDVRGVNRLQLTLVHENVTWFEERGASTLTVPVTVE